MWDKALNLSKNVFLPLQIGGTSNFADSPLIGSV